MSLDFTSGAKPLWSQLANLLREKIEKGEYKAGDILPPEMQLIDTYGISRITVRQAMDNLMNEGYIERRRGKGTIVLNKEENVSTAMKSSFKQLKENGERAEKKLIEVNFVKAPKEVAEFFKITEDDNVILMKRVIEVEGKVVTLFYNYINPNIPITVKDNFAGSFYELLREKGFPVTSGREVISAALSNRDDKKIFGITEQKAILKRKKYGYSNGVPVELTYSRYLAEEYVITIDLK
ncbi:UTRA domain-containing protein [Clostridium perfringens]|nr:GntR family transcriptional regulator [Clostridium perfringens]MDZ5016513.1 UTRA domain-containing protein [Clostridium perfringens]